MHDIKNFWLAWASSVSTLFALDSDRLITIISAIVLPAVFFTVGKTVDVCLQIYFENREEAKGLSRTKVDDTDSGEGNDF